MKLAVIGNWGHYPQVLKETERTGEHPVLAFAKGTPDEKLDGLRQKFPSAANAALYDDHRRMLAEIKPDLVLVSTRLDRIADLATDAARAGAHLICEKPLAIDRDRLHTLWNIVAENRVQCLAMLNNRAHPLLAAATTAVRKSQIGAPKLFNARKSYRFGKRPDWFGERSFYGGTIPWVGIHALDFIDAVSPADCVSAAAMHANTAHPERPGCEDACTMLLQRADGSLASVSVDYLRPQSAPTHGDDWLRIVGTNGVIEIAMDRNQGTISTGDTPQTDLAPLAEADYYLPLIQSLPSHGNAVPTGATRRAFSLTHTALCARDAADNKTVLDIPPAPWTLK